MNAGISQGESCLEHSFLIYLECIILNGPSKALDTGNCRHGENSLISSGSEPGMHASQAES